MFTQAGDVRLQLDPERFTSADAYEAHEEGEPILITRRMAERLIDQHQPGDDRAEFWMAHDGATHIDAWMVLAWLGY